jgi:molybdopterin-biosynthesis enzyme MoeA-like protein
MKGIFGQTVAPVWEERFGATGFATREVFTDCEDETAIAAPLKKVKAEHSEVDVKSRARSFGPVAQIWITLSAPASTHAEAASRVEAARASLQKALEEAGVRLLDEADAG